MKTKFKIIILGLLLALSIQLPVYGQKDTVQLRPSFWAGVAAGGNFNFYQGSTQDISADLFSYPAFTNGYGVGLFVAPALMYHESDKVFGVMLEAGYDSRKGDFDQVIHPCNCPADLNTNLRYATIEPSILVYPFKGNLYLYGGPRFAFNIGKQFAYDRGASEDGLTPAEPTLEGDFTSINKWITSAHIGIGYDMLISSRDKDNKIKEVILSPFIDVHPYFGQNPRSIETWNITTVRAGAVLKFGHVKKPAKIKPVIPVIQEPIVKKDSVFIEEEQEVWPVPPYVIVPPTAPTTVFFDFDKSILTEQAKIDLDKLSSKIDSSTAAIVVKSYADIRGSAEYNSKLSQRRSAAVVDYLISKGINTSRIHPMSLGETEFFNNNSSNRESAYALNRRSTITVIVVTNTK